ncbi:MAG: transketolase [Alphaproteobacteria bacterium]|nr:transketolase [Alphaproteobacteria bacterium]
MSSAARNTVSPTQYHGVQLTPMANALRVLAMDAVEAANSGHPGMPMGMADVATVLFRDFLKYDAADPHWPDRDRFILSAGHGSMLLYGLLYLTGNPEMTIDQIQKFRQLDALTPGHPEYGHTSGVETTTGPLGQGLANAVGFALAERLLNAEFGDALVDHRTYVIAGDGCLMEGISQEAISLAGHLRLNRLVVLWDDNQISIDGGTDLSTSDNMLQRFAASGWATEQIDGHDQAAIHAALMRAQSATRPSLIACRTIIGLGAPTKQGSAAVHGAPLGKDEVARARAQLNWAYPPFIIPNDILSEWRKAGSRGEMVKNAWQKRLDAAPAALKSAWHSRQKGEISAEIVPAIAEYKRQLITAEKPEATRISSQKTLEILAPICPGLLGGSADLTGSNNTKVAAQIPLSPENLRQQNYRADYIYYGIREHGMAAAMNGLALHGGIIPYGGTFLVFSDYCRPSIRLSALMGARVIYVFTHDSIGLGEDGPTHQPVEHMAALRAIPNLLVFRPSDAVETAEAWLAALQSAHRPSVLALTRQNLPLLRREFFADNLLAKGGYVLREAAGGKRDISLLASGSELHLAVAAADELAKAGLKAAVISMPCHELFAEQTPEYRQAVLGTAPRLAIEAATGLGWERWTGGHQINGENRHFIGMTGFGASAPAAQLFQKFGMTVPVLVARARELCQSPKK